MAEEFAVRVPLPMRVVVPLSVWKKRTPVMFPVRVPLGASAEAVALRVMFEPSGEKVEEAATETTLLAWTGVAP